LTHVAYKKIFLEVVVKPNVLNLEPNWDVVREAQIKELPALLDYLNQEVKPFSWIAGDEFSIADIAIATQLIALKMAGFEIKDKWEDLGCYLTTVLNRPSFRRIIK
jgi:glutathione S-transferase